MSDKVTPAETALPALFGYDVTCKRSGQVLHIAWGSGVGNAGSKQGAVRMTKARRRASRRSRRSKWLGTTGLLIGLAVVGGVVAVVLLELRRTPRLDATNAMHVETGRRIYAEACASCHGTSLEGQSNWQERLPDGRLPAPPLGASGQAWRHTDPTLFAITKKGPAAHPHGYQTDMPAFGRRLTDDEIAAALAFIKSTWPDDMRARQARRNLKTLTAPAH